MKKFLNGLGIFMKKKIAIIGLGENGRKHLSELRRSDYFELVALCDKHLTDEFGRFEVFDNIDDMFNYKNPEAVVIATPANTHKELILKCMRYVKNIFVESPLAASLAEAREINYAVKTNNLKLGVGYNDRFNPTIISLIKELSKDEMIYSINIINAIDGDQNYDMISELIIKDLDLVRFITGFEIVNFDMKKTFFENSKKPSVATATFRTKNDIIVSLLASLFYPARKHKLEISTSSGIYLADLINLTLHKITPNGRMNLKVDSENFSIRYEHKSFLDICENKEFGSLASTDDAVKAREIIK